jgi:hypothetical protein
VATKVLSEASVRPASTTTKPAIPSIKECPVSQQLMVHGQGDRRENRQLVSNGNG